MTYSIKILDDKGKIVGELPTATETDIMKFINKGFNVLDIMSGQQITSENISTTIGVSDGLINIG